MSRAVSEEKTKFSNGRMAKGNGGGRRVQVCLHACMIPVQIGVKSHNQFAERRGRGLAKLVGTTEERRLRLPAVMPLTKI